MLKTKKPVFEKAILIMVIDDSEIFRKQIIGAIKTLDIPFKVLEAPNVAVAKKALEKYKFDIIMCDQNMPGETGIDFVEYAVEKKKIATPILMITSESGISTILEAIEKGAKDYLIKPWKEEDFANKFFACFGSHVKQETSQEIKDRNVRNMEVQLSEISRMEPIETQRNPFVKEQKETPEIKSQINLPPSSTILILEDSQQYREAIKKSLQELSYQGNIIEAENAQIGFELLEKETVSLGLFDLNMPGKTGVELVKELRVLPRYQKLGIVMLTAENEISQMLDAIDSGVDDYLVKPYKTEDLRDKINQTWNKYQKKSYKK